MCTGASNRSTDTLLEQCLHSFWLHAWQPPTHIGTHLGDTSSRGRQVSFQLVQAGFGEDVQRIGTDTLLLAGAHWLQQPIYDLESATNQPVGYANVTSANARILCVPDPFAGAGGLPSGGAPPSTSPNSPRKLGRVGYGWASTSS